MASVLKWLRPKKRHQRFVHSQKSEHYEDTVIKWPSASQEEKTPKTRPLRYLIWDVKVLQHQGNTFLLVMPASCGVLLSSWLATQLWCPAVSLAFPHHLPGLSSASALFQVSLGAHVWDICCNNSFCSALSSKTISCPSLTLQLTVPSLNIIISLIQQRRIITSVVE